MGNWVLTKSKLLSKGHKGCSKCVSWHHWRFLVAASVRIVKGWWVNDRKKYLMNNLHTNIL